MRILFVLLLFISGCAKEELPELGSYTVTVMIVPRAEMKRICGDVNACTWAVGDTVAMVFDQLTWRDYLEHETEHVLGIGHGDEAVSE